MTYCAFKVTRLIPKLNSSDSSAQFDDNLPRGFENLPSTVIESTTPTECSRSRESDAVCICVCVHVYLDRATHSLVGVPAWTTPKRARVCACVGWLNYYWSVCSVENDPAGFVCVCNWVNECQWSDWHDEPWLPQQRKHTYTHDWSNDSPNVPVCVCVVHAPKEVQAHWLIACEIQLWETSRSLSRSLSLTYTRAQEKISSFNALCVHLSFKGGTFREMDIHYYTHTHTWSIIINCIGRDEVYVGYIASVVIATFYSIN